MKGSFATEAEKLFNPGNNTIMSIRHANAHVMPAIILIFLILGNIRK
jgi:hypothetical protein